MWQHIRQGMATRRKQKAKQKTTSTNSEKEEEKQQEKNTKKTRKNHENGTRKKHETIKIHNPGLWLVKNLISTIILCLMPDFQFMVYQCLRIPQRCTPKPSTLPKVFSPIRLGNLHLIQNPVQLKPPKKHFWSSLRWCLRQSLENHWVGLKEMSNRTPPYFIWRTMGFRLRFSLTPIHETPIMTFETVKSQIKSHLPTIYWTVLGGSSQ